MLEFVLNPQLARSVCDATQIPIIICLPNTTMKKVFQEET